MVPCGDGMKDEDRSESCDNGSTLWSHPLSSEHEPEPLLDGPGESARFTPLNNFFILNNTCNNNTQQEVHSTLGVSISVSRTGGWKQRVV
jgi:hypothetical protein